MLILTRRVGERLMIGDNTCLVVLRTKGSQVRLGVSAPTSVSVQRVELVAGSTKSMPLTGHPGEATGD